MPAPPLRRQQILQVLWDNGPMTSEDLAEFLGITHVLASNSIAQCRREHGAKYFRIHEWSQSFDKAGGKHIPIYGYGNGKPDKPKPVKTREQLLLEKRQYYARNKVRLLTTRRKRRGVKQGANLFSHVLGQYELFTTYAEAELEILERHLHRPRLAHTELEKAGFIRSLASVKKKMASIVKKRTGNMPQQVAVQQSMEFQ